MVKKENKKKNPQEFKKRIIVLVSILVVLGLIVISMAMFSDVEKQDNGCSQDSDCVKVQTTCCPCSMGGVEKCVPGERADEIRINKSECPENQICTAMYNCNENPCGCENGNCTFSK